MCLFPGKKVPSEKTRKVPEEGGEIWAPREVWRNPLDLFQLGLWEALSCADGMQQEPVVDWILGCCPEHESSGIGTSVLVRKETPPFDEARLTGGRDYSW